MGFGLIISRLLKVLAMGFWTETISEWKLPITRFLKSSEIGLPVFGRQKGTTQPRVLMRNSSQSTYLDPSLVE
ncbi:hypothetical protein PNOK_0951400 [Pyrrhoderma noxium]|uniref:Uncharacterized protein n=1 Tax=Pyrrhoderma noxium TaxID=2282107 RepID=A0A286U5T5_9AGAM|nr:hypothetical protein PNOK_0951400 [Pyrrhoderma noxium]